MTSAERIEPSGYVYRDNCELSKIGAATEQYASVSSNSGLIHGFQYGQGRPIDYCEISVRVAGCMKAFGITHTNQIPMFRTSELLRQRNFGRGSLRELMDMLRRCGLTQPADG